MKLIDILVEELPKRGGWPEGSTRCMQTDGLYVTFPDIGDHCDFVAKCMAEGVRIATREQYEAALADSKPKWDGKGLPPLGMEIEYKFTKVNYRTCFSRGKVLAYGMHNVFMEHWSSKNEFIQPLDKIEFRPIRSEADKKRDAAIESMASLIDYRSGCSAKPLAKWIFDEIAAGKIPHVRID